MKNNNVLQMFFDSVLTKTDDGDKITALFTNGATATYTRDFLPVLASDAETVHVYDNETGEILYISQN